LLAVLNLSILIPFVYIVAIYAVPLLSDVGTFVITSHAGWTYLDLSINSLVFGLLYFVFLLLFLNKVRELSFYVVVFLGAIALGANMMCNFSMLFMRELPFYLMFIIQIFSAFLTYVSRDLPTIALVGKFSEICPKGLEATGITILLSIANVGNFVNGIVSGQEVRHFNVYQGYYERLKWPLTINSIAANLIILAAPGFLLW